MSNAATWQEENTRTLSAAIAYVRALLQRRAQANETLPARTKPDKPDELGTWFRRRRKPALLEAAPATTRVVAGDGDQPYVASAMPPPSETAMPPATLIVLRDR